MKIVSHQAVAVQDAYFSRDTAAALADLPAVAVPSEAAEVATGTAGPVSSCAIVALDVASDGISGHSRGLAGKRAGGVKTRKNPGKTSVFRGVKVSEADGTRTRNHRIDSPVL